jgi:hypothetical protein
MNSLFVLSCIYMKCQNLAICSFSTIDWILLFEMTCYWFHVVFQFTCPKIAINWISEVMML